VRGWAARSGSQGAARAARAVCACDRGPSPAPRARERAAAAGPARAAPGAPGPLALPRRSPAPHLSLQLLLLRPGTSTATVAHARSPNLRTAARSMSSSCGAHGTGASRKAFSDAPAAGRPRGARRARGRARSCATPISGTAPPGRTCSVQADLDCPLDCIFAVATAPGPQGAAPIDRASWRAALFAARWSVLNMVLRALIKRLPRNGGVPARSCCVSRRADGGARGPAGAVGACRGGGKRKLEWFNGGATRRGTRIAPLRRKCGRTWVPRHRTVAAGAAPPRLW
jgi:hypothetical protein